jgi:hypothetical protein
LLKVFDNLNDTTATVVADLRTNVHNFWDRGMLGMALDPQFPQRPYVYCSTPTTRSLAAQPPAGGRRAPPPIPALTPLEQRATAA